MELFDSHAHYDDEKFNEDRDELIMKIYNSGIKKIVSAGYSLESSKKSIELSGKYEFIYSTCGISPNDIPYVNSEVPYKEQDILKEFYKQLQEIEELAKFEKVVAIGEIGLDYHWHTDNKEIQKQVFIDQIKLANKLNLPIVIHTRDAVMDTLDILKNKIKTVKPGIFHCCPLNVELVREATKLGFYISFAGPVTFKNSKNAQEVVNMVPLDKILIETDSPYLSPEPKRGQRNDSRNVKCILDKISEIKGIEVNELAEIIYNNTINALDI